MKKILIVSMLVFFSGCCSENEKLKDEVGQSFKKTTHATGFVSGTGCLKGSECLSGICEGEGCGDKKGVCVSGTRMCTRDLRPYCGCDDKTFFASGSCPARRFQKKGPCKVGDKPFSQPVIKIPSTQKANTNESK